MINETPLTKKSSLELWLNTKDERHFNEVYAQIHKGLYRHIYKIVRDEDVANDIVSDTFCSILQNINQYDPSRGAFSTWAYNIAQNAAYAWLNFEKKQEKLRHDSFTIMYSTRGIFATDSFEDHESKEEYIESLENPDIDLEVLMGKVHQRVVFEIQQLSDVYRDCVYDREIRGLSYQVIAHRRNLKINTVKSKIRLGREIVMHEVINYMKQLGIDPESLSVIIPGIRKTL
jgi:RNA polymerase sigma-70 factor (ECF subfamily)